MEIKELEHGGIIYHAENFPQTWEIMIKGYQYLNSKMIEIENRLKNKYPNMEIFRGFYHTLDYKDKISKGTSAFLVIPEGLEDNCNRVYLPCEDYKPEHLEEFKNRGIIACPEYIIGAIFSGGPYIRIDGPSDPKYKEDHDLVKHLLRDD